MKSKKNAAKPAGYGNHGTQPTRKCDDEGIYGRKKNTTKSLKKPG
jgi:hypothetical protein